MVLMSGDDVKFGDAVSTDTQFGQEFLQQVIAVLNPTPTPSAAPSATPTPAPISLPRSGGATQETPSGAAWCVWAAGAVVGLAAFAYVLRRRIMGAL